LSGFKDSNSNSATATPTFVNSADFPNSYAVPQLEKTYPYKRFRAEYFVAGNSVHYNLTLTVDFLGHAQADVTFGLNSPAGQRELFCAGAAYIIKRRNILFGTEDDCVAHAVFETNDLDNALERKELPIAISWAFGPPTL